MAESKYMIAGDEDPTNDNDEINIREIGPKSPSIAINADTQTYNDNNIDYEQYLEYLKNSKDKYIEYKFE